MWSVPLLPRPTLGAAARLLLLATAAERIARGARRAPAIRPEEGSPDVDDVTVIVPARDEAERIGPCVRALVPTGATVLVVDDGSTDGTRDIAEAAGATVIDAGPLPAGWAGKTHALQVGLEHATTRVVVAVDADTRPEPGFLPAIVRTLGDRTLVTAGTRVDAPDAGGRLVHASMLATLVYRFGPPGVDARSPDRIVANGQCMVFDRTALVDVGGFGRVAGSLTEDVELARTLARDGHDVAFEDATEAITVEGYGSAGETLAGWGRSLALREVTSPAWMVADLAVVWSAMVLPLPRLLARRGDVIDVAALGLRLGVAATTAGAFRQRGAPILLAPLADLAVAGTLTAGAVRPRRSWRGRTYPRA